MNKQIMSLLAVTMFLLGFNAPLTAQELDNKVSDSNGQYQNSKLNDDIKSKVNLNNVEALQKQVLYGLTRDIVQKKRSIEVKNRKSNIAVAKKSNNEALSHTSFSIYGFSIFSASSELIDDFDYDGFYQTFGVTFDADLHSSIIGESALVYADLYLSRNGGPWELYFTTDNFEIYGESEDDAFEVTTNLYSGYLPDHYDVLIDLYEHGYSDIVATYSANDTNELYALPIESSDYDPEFVEVEYYEEHSGAMHFLLLIAALILSIRKNTQ